MPRHQGRRRALLLPGRRRRLAAAGHAHARLVWPEVPWGTDKHVHHRLGRFLARRKAIQVRHVRDIEVLGSRALVGRDRVGWWYAVGDGQLR